MKNIIYLFFFLANICFGQSVKWSAPEIEQYSKSIETLKAENKLVKISCTNMSAYGGGVNGYYLNNKLVLIEATYQAELGFTSRNMYMQGAQFVKIIYREHSAEWGKYEEKYPHDKFEFDPKKMNYADTVYTITFTNPIVFHKQAGAKMVSNKPDPLLLKELLSCGKQMKLELQEVITRTDRLKYVKEMPYSCESEICGDKLYWLAVSIGQRNIELLIDKLDDTTSTQVNIVLFGGTYAVADISYSVLNEIIHDMPTFELLGVPFDQEGCGYCSYWQHLNKDISNRRKFKEAVKHWYFSNKDRLVWVKSQKFSTCECKGQHPNGGHYELQAGGK